MENLKLITPESETQEVGTEIESSDEGGRSVMTQLFFLCVMVAMMVMVTNLAINGFKSSVSASESVSAESVR